MSFGICECGAYRPMQQDEGTESEWVAPCQACEKIAELKVKLVRAKELEESAKATTRVAKADNDVLRARLDALLNGGRR